jgi:hypothetical protein
MIRKLQRVVVVPGSRSAGSSSVPHVISWDGIPLKLATSLISIFYLPWWEWNVSVWAWSTCVQLDVLSILRQSYVDSAGSWDRSWLMWSWRCHGVSCQVGVRAHYKINLLGIVHNTSRSGSNIHCFGVCSLTLVKFEDMTTHSTSQKNWCISWVPSCDRAERAQQIKLVNRARITTRIDIEVTLKCALWNTIVANRVRHWASASTCLAHQEELLDRIVQPNLLCSTHSDFKCHIGIFDHLITVDSNMCCESILQLNVNSSRSSGTRVHKGRFGCVRPIIAWVVLKGVPQNWTIAGVLDVPLVVVCGIDVQLMDLRRATSGQHQVTWVAVCVEVVMGSARS